MSLSTQDGKDEQNSSIISKEFLKPEPVLQNHQVAEANIFYGIFIPCDQLNDSEDVKKVYTKKNECLNVLKKYQGARFKGFPTYEEALCFSEYGPIVCTPCKGSENHIEPQSSTSVGEKPSPFRGPKSQDLVKFRKAIEKGNVDYFEECVKTNPRYLISSGDTPAILQEGSRYNALHIACRNDKPEFCNNILSIICDAKFFQKLYPDDSISSSERRSEFLIDLYLNTPDKGLNETPLHFACKHGSLGCVKNLLCYPTCDRTRLNKYGQTPREVICSRVSKPDVHLSKKINELFEEQYYVPVLRDEDNCLTPVIGIPWSPLNNGDSFSPPSHSSPQHSNSPISPLFKIRGFAGPMSPQKADSFYGRWKKSVVPSPTRNSKGKIAALRITDQEKGLERIGRNLATEFDVDWVEYWSFLGNFSNITTEEGQQKFEDHLKFKYREVIKLRNQEETNFIFDQLKNKLPTSDQILDLTQSTFNDGESNINFDSTRSTLSSIGGLCQDLEALRLNASLSPNQETGICKTKSDTISSLKRKLSQSQSNSCSKKPILKKPNETFSQTSRSDLNESSNINNNNNNNNEFNKSETNSFKDDSQLENEHYNFAIQSTRISSQRLSSFLGEISGTISSHVGPDFQVTRKLRNQIKPELGSLRKVLGRCIASSSEETLDFSFVHVFLAAKTFEHLMENVSTSNLFLISETLKMLVANMDSFDESSSDEEGNVETCVDDLERKEVMSHFRCVVQKLEKSCILSMELMKEGKEDSQINLIELEDCECSWNGLKASQTLKNSLRFHPVDTKPINDTLNNSKSNKEKRRKARSGRLSKAHSFVNRILFGKKEEGEQEQSPEVIPVFESYSKNKSHSFDAISGKQDDSGQEEDTEDNESFASAVSSLEEDNELATPEQEIKVFINGCEPSKDDYHVYIAIEDLSIEEDVYPYISRWIRLVESYSAETRGRWPSSCHGYRPTASASFTP